MPSTPDGPPRASRCGHCQRDVTRAGADVEDPQRVTFQSAMGRHKTAQRPKREVGATEAPVDPPEVAQVTVEDIEVGQGAIEVLPGIGEAAHGLE